jgi:hypothetical protein
MRGGGAIPNTMVVTDSSPASTILKIQTSSIDQSNLNRLFKGGNGKRSSSSTKKHKHKRSKSQKSTKKKHKRSKKQFGGTGGVPCCNNNNDYGYPCPSGMCGPVAQVSNPLSQTLLTQSAIISATGAANAQFDSRAI